MKSFNIFAPNNSSAHLMDWEEVISPIAQYAYFDRTKKSFYADPFINISREGIKKELDAVEATFNFLSSEDSIDGPIFSGPSPSTSFEELEKIFKGHHLSLEDINTLILLCSNYLALLKLPYLRNFVQDIEHSISSRFRSKILIPWQKTVQENGTARFEGHPIIGPAMKKADDLRLQIRERLNSLSQNDLFKSAMQFDGHDNIQGQYCVAIRSDAYKATMGQIIAHSKTGMTLWVFPNSVRTLCNKLNELEAHIEYEISKFVKRFQDLLLEVSSNLMKCSLRETLRIDRWFMKANFALSGSYCRATVDGERVFLKDFFHPLIEDPVTNTLELESDKNGLIISGPNTGGKTVSLKAMALCLIFHRCGLFVPAAEAILPQASQIFFFGHDHQDLSQGLSSFASETKNYLELLEQIEEGAFIFIDEIFNSTSSEDASALAMGLLDELKKKKAKAFISTHHQMFKTYLHQDKSYLSAHVGLNIEKSSPSYKLIHDGPGSSLALTIFEKIGGESSFTAPILSRAYKTLDSKALSYESLLQDLSLQKQELNERLGEQKALTKELRNQKKAQEGLLAIERSDQIARHNLELEKILKRARKAYDDLKRGEITYKTFEKQAPRPLSVQTKKAVHRDLGQFTQAKWEHLKVGTKVFVKKLGGHFTVAQVDAKKKKIIVSKGLIKTQVMLAEVSLPSSVKEVPKEEKTSTRSYDFTQSSVELDGRGLRQSEFENRVELALQSLLVGDIPYLSVIHGHGTGVLKNWLRGHLNDFKNLYKWEQEQGNDGVTIIKTVT